MADSTDRFSRLAGGTAGCSRFPRGETPSYSVRMTVEVGGSQKEAGEGQEEEQQGRVKTITIGEFCWTGT